MTAPSSPVRHPKMRAGLGKALLLIGLIPAASLAARDGAARDGTAPVASAPRSAADSAETHRSLRKAIEHFQDRWRSAWQKVEMKRHRAINLTQIRGWVVTRTGSVEAPAFDGDRAAMNLTSDVRRYLSILCSVDTPSDRQIEVTKSRAKASIGIPIRKPRFSPLAEDAAMRASAAPPKAPASGSSSWATRRVIRDPKGSVCPSWVPEDLPLPLDEGEAIDLAIPVAGREVLRKERDALIQQLEAAHAQFPTDEWIAGQRVRFVLDQRSPARMVAAANACRGRPRWCLSLQGLALEHAGNLWAADSVFRTVEALTRSEPSTVDNVCIDADVLLLLAVGDRAEVTKLACGDQQLFVQRLWWMTDPLWSIPGNERFVAHYARQTHAGLRSVLERDERYVWSPQGGGAAQRELVLRYGWPSYSYWPGGQFEEEMNVLRELDARVWTPSPPYTSREYSRDRQSLLPSVRAINNPFLTHPDDWQTSAPVGSSAEDWWPREHMMLWTRLVTLPEGQFVQLRRDSMVLVAMAVDDALHSLDTAATGPSVAALLGSSSPALVTAFSRSTLVSGQTLRLSAAIPSAPVVLSAEVQARTRREPALRRRFGITPSPTLRDMTPGAVALSSPVFMRQPLDASSATTQIDSVLSSMMGGLVFSRAERLAVYWEGYGFAMGDTVDIRLRVSRSEESGTLRRAAEVLGVVPERRDSISIGWREPDVRQGSVLPTLSKRASARALVLNLQELPAGAYRIGIEMRRVDGAMARSDRQFVLRD